MCGATEEGSYIGCTMSNSDGAIALQQFYVLERNAGKRRSNAHILLEALRPISNYSISDLTDDDMLIKLLLVLPADGSKAGRLIRSLANGGIECQGGYIRLHREMPTISNSLRSISFDENIRIPIL